MSEVTPQEGTTGNDVANAPVAQTATGQKIDPASLAEKLLYTTVRIVASKAGEESVGTGAIYEFSVKDSEQVVPCLVTNRHVIEGFTDNTFLLHTRSGKSGAPDGFCEVRGTEFGLGKGWLPHPNPAVDLCILPLAQIQKLVPATPYYIALTRADLPSQQDLNALDAVEQVLMIGYPNGLWDEENKYPLVRRGTTASHPGVDFVVKGVPTTVIDIAAFPGSSGSPVFVYDKGAIADKATNGVKFGSRAVFIGHLYAGPVMKKDGDLEIRQIPTAMTAVPSIQLMINLGYVIKPREIAVLAQALFADRKISWPD